MVKLWRLFRIARSSSWHRDFRNKFIHDFISLEFVDVSGTHPAAAGVLGGARVRVAAALRCGSGFGDHGAGDFFAGAGAEALQSGVCAALAASGGRAVRGESEPAVQAHAVASDIEASAGECARAVFGVAWGDRY